jgi:hypothetical protein
VKRLILALLLCLACPLWAADVPQVTARILLQSLPLAGFRYHEGKEIWDELKVGDSLQLVREPDNPHDQKAVRVDWHGHVLGYVPRAENSAVARQMDMGEKLEARIVKLRKSRNPRERVLFEIYLKP